MSESFMVESGSERFITYRRRISDLKEIRKEV